MISRTPNERRISRPLQPVLILVLILSLSLALSACSLPAPAPEPQEPPVTTPPGSEAPAEDRSYTTPPFAFPIRGDYHEALYLEQAALREKGLLFGLLIEDTAAWNHAVETYGFISDRIGQTLNYADVYFENYALLIVFADQGSSSIQYQFGKAEATDFLIDVTLEQYLPEIMTEDIVMKGFVVGLEKTGLHFSDGTQKPLNITQRSIPLTYGTPSSELTVEDLRLGNLAVRLAALELDFRMSQKPERVELAHDGYEETRYYEDGVKILILENEVFMISTESPNYPTPRGLKVGDSLETLTTLYGEAPRVETLENGNTLHSFALSEGQYLLFHAELREETIVRLQVNLTM